jgi:predicted dienelactone hydrolase
MKSRRTAGHPAHLAALLAVVLAALAFTWTAASAAAQSTAAPQAEAGTPETLPDPRQLGPYPVGVTTLAIVDPTRLDEATKGPRTLLLEVWYPATDETRDLEPNKLSDFLLRGAHPGLNVAVRMAFGADATTLDPSFMNYAVRDARVRDGKFPLIVFSHGNGGLRNQNSFWCDHMASHGYVVAAPDHTGNSRVTVVEGRLVLYNPNGTDASAHHRPRDLSFVIDRMAAMNRGEDSRFAGRLDMERIGVAGHSFGGYTAAAVINMDPRVDAIIPMTPVLPERTNYDTPVLVMVATEDATIGLQGNEKARRYFQESRGPSYLVELLDAGHFSFTDMFQIDPDYGDGVGSGEKITAPGEPIQYLGMAETYDVINTYSAAFFGVYVKGEPAYAPYLGQNPFGERVIVQTVQAAAPAADTAAAPTGDGPQPAEQPEPEVSEAPTSTVREVSIVGDSAPAGAVVGP